MFDRYVGVDYSGAETPSSSLKGLRVYLATPSDAAVEITPPPGPKKYWTRRGVAEWLRELLSEQKSTFVGIDHGFSFPLRYFEAHRLALKWDFFLEDFRQHWPTHEDTVYVDFVREGNLRTGNSRWRRIADIAAGAKSVFHFDVQGSVAKSTHSGLPWLLHIRSHARRPVHFWPFDGWEPTPGASVVAEAYPRLYSAAYPREDRTPDQHDAFSIAVWLRDSDRSGALQDALRPALDPADLTAAAIEGWILGVTAPLNRPISRPSGS